MRPDRRLRTLAFVAVAVVAIVGSGVACSGSSPGPATPEADAIEVDAPTLTQLRDGAHAFQLSLVSGNRFARGGYDRLAATYQQCIAEVGAELTDNSMETAYGTYHFEISYPAGAGAAVAACTREYWEPLGPLWSLSHMASREQIQAGNDALGECLRRAGEDFPYEHPTLDDFGRLNGERGRFGPTFFECTREVGRELKLPNFAGG